jgi:hypothetical protein
MACCCIHCSKLFEQFLEKLQPSTITQKFDLLHFKQFCFSKNENCLNYNFSKLDEVLVDEKMGCLKKMFFRTEL